MMEYSVMNPQNIGLPNFYSFLSFLYFFFLCAKCTTQNRVQSYRKVKPKPHDDKS